MSSDPATDDPPAGRWRRPRTWSLRTRLVAVMIGLLAVLGLAVGSAAEIYLHTTLYHQVDQQLAELDQRGTRFRPPGLAAPAGAPPGAVLLTVRNRADVTVANGGRVVLRQADATTHPELGVEQLPDAAVRTLAGVTPDAPPVSVDLGAGLGDYRVVASTAGPRGTVITGLPLAETQSTLLRVALVTGGAVLAALVVAGWAGAVIVRRNLTPLERVAATATRVSELRLDRGEVDLAQRVPEPDTDTRTEVGLVGAALNRLLDHVGHALAARQRSETQVRQFVADASHELRTPLAAIRGYAELSRRSRGPVPDEVAHVLRRVESEAQRMTTLVEDLLLLARLDAGRPLAHDPVDLTMLVVDAVSDAHAAGLGHRWQLDVPEEPVMVSGDPIRLTQVVANLLANARTHTPEGSTVTVKVDTAPDAAVLQVIDDGPGIQPDLVPRIFERFARGDSSRSRAAGSTGLGLSIVHAVVTSHGGRVGVQSRPGRTVFTVMLPLEPPPVVPTAELEPQMLHPVG